MKTRVALFLLACMLSGCAGCSKTGNHRHEPDSTRRTS